jgi:transcriptional regulator with XRE-family HTH domain
VTNRAKHDATTQPELGFLANHKELLAIRVRPAEFARLLGVSKQTVSTWIRDGKVTINTLDGLLDVRRAIQDVLRNTSPGRLRSRVLRQAVTDALELRENLARAEDRAEAAEAALREARATIAHLERWDADGDAHAETFRALIIENAETLRATPAEAWAQTLSDLSDAAWDVVDPESAPAALDAAMRAIHETEGGGDAQPDPVDAWLAEMELDPAIAAELAALDAQLAADQSGE